MYAFLVWFLNTNVIFYYQFNASKIWGIVN